MEFKSCFISMLMILVGFLSSTGAYKFYVGGKDGWVVNPHENYNHWAERNRFQVNDTLFFKYKNGTDSILVVTKDAYNTCNTTNPKKILQNGDSEFKFDRSGPFFFISGNCTSCRNGQKLVVVVLAVRHKTPIAPTPALPSRPSYLAPAPSPTKSAASMSYVRPMNMIFGFSVVVLSVIMLGTLV